MALAYSLFLDDERYPPSGPAPKKMWIICRSYSSAVELCSGRGMPNFVSFDHDLGDGPTGYDFAKWLIDCDLNGVRWPDDFAYTVHSMNPIGAENIDAIMQGYLRHR